MCKITSIVNPFLCSLVEGFQAKFILLAMADEPTRKISLKALVNRGNKRVIFMESGHEFVDVLLSYLTIPIGTIIKLGRNNSNLAPLGIGCMNNLYASVVNMDVQHFRTEACRDMLLCPRNGAGSTLKSLKLKIDDCDPTQYFKCSNVSCRTSPARLSYYRSVRCCRCGNQMDSKSNLLVGCLDGVFVKGLARLIISDDLQVMPAVTSVSSSLLMKPGVMDSNTIEEVTLDTGVDEVVNLLMCSFISKSPLTDVLLQHRPLANLNKNISNQPICVDYYSARVEDTVNDEANITLKLILSKSKKVICYAEAEEDFVNLLFSFLVLPLGFLLKQMRLGTLKGCIDHLYKSVRDLDQQLLKSRYSKEVLVNPKLPPGFCYQNHPLGIGTATFHIAAAEIVDPKSPSGEDSDQGFLKGPALFVVTDNLIVSPVSSVLGPSILDKMNVPITDIEVQTVLVGKEEVSSTTFHFISANESFS
ncbi:hypothetical protein RchiOBHm_Chr5g0067491 [Rosa chinensis]|uniref:DUF674 family protein n=1 Tax=Rosa chinensis TaxID=74649 RepID=A0A2P6QJI4_ROSCH|nr:hypothetical protein RchiOBHm_Chr5g0067491 [Rosa chinensis]